MKLLAAALLLVALAGCSAGADEAPATPGEEPSAAAEHGTEAEVVGYPVGWPEKDVPMVDGTLLHFAHPGNLWAGWVEAHDLVADLAAAQQLLVDAGYTITLTHDAYFEFSNADRVGRVVAADDAQWGPCLLYTFTDGATEPTGAEEQHDEAPASEH